jgi:hypothetical protein
MEQARKLTISELSKYLHVHEKPQFAGCSEKENRRVSRRELLAL